MWKNSVQKQGYMDLYQAQITNELTRAYVLEQEEVSFWYLFFILVWTNLI